MTHRRTVLSVVVWLVALSITAPSAAQQPDVSTVVTRMGAYIQQFETRMATIVADERYVQTMRSSGGRETRTLRSEYALLRVAGRGEWVGFRDTFEVDGKPVRDHDDRLQQLVTSGSLAAAARVANESARFNLGTDLVPRNINVPTLVLELLRPTNRDRFSFRKIGEETLGGVRTWQIDYRERERPTIVRAADGHDQRSTGAVWVDPATGEIRRTLVLWDSTPRRTLGRMTVTYDRVPGVDMPVPVLMSEQYEPGSATLEGEATYSNFRQFSTDARIVGP